MVSPRIYWLGCHQTLRYEEVPLLIEAGAEVIPDIGDPNWLKYDSDYNNENHELYPNWRLFCTMPNNIVEKIREIRFWENRGEVSFDEAKLINNWIDVMFISHYPDILANITKWFKGYIVYRVFGIGDFTTYTDLMRNMNIDIDNVISSDKYIWAPIRNSLHPSEDPKIMKNKLYLNAFASKERLKFKWRFKNSRAFVTTNISYIDGNPIAKDILKSFNEKFYDIPFVVLGKNSKNAAKDICDNVLGYVDDDKFYSKIAESRVFAYVGLKSNYHLHYPPIEAISMGVPVIFLEKSGLAQEARDNGFSDKKLEKIGMCSDINDMREKIAKIMNDFNTLEKIAHEQSEVFGKIFSREAALVKTKNFIDEIQLYVKEHRKNLDCEPIYYNTVEKNVIQNNNIETDLPTEVGQRVVFSTERIKGFSGKLIYDYQRKFIGRRVEEGIDSQGLFIANYIRRMEPGEYLFSLELNNLRDYSGLQGLLLLGVWHNEFNVLNSKNVSNLKQGKNIVDIAVNIKPKDADALKEIRIFWNGAPTCELKTITVEKLT